MSPNISPISIQPHLRCGRSGASHLKHPTGNSQRRIRRHHLHARNPFGHLPSVRGGDVALLAVVEVDVADFVARDVCKGLGGSEVREVATVLLEDELLVGAGGHRLRCVGPGAGVLCGVICAVVKGTKGDTDVEI